MIMWCPYFVYCGVSFVIQKALFSNGQERTPSTLKGWLLGVSCSRRPVRKPLDLVPVGEAAEMHQKIEDLSEWGWTNGSGNKY